MNESPRALLESREFRQLVADRWRISLILSALLFLLYYGYIVLIAVNRGLVSRRIGAATTLGIPLGAAVILGAWILTAAYVIWANRHYDREVARLRARVAPMGPTGSQAPSAGSGPAPSTGSGRAR